MTRSPDKPTPSRNNDSRLATSKNDNSKPASRRNDGDGEVNGFGVSRNGIEHAKKSEKLSKSRKSKSKKMSKSWNLAKSGKKLSKSRNLTNFDAIENGPKFLTPNTRTAFNHLWLAFIKSQFFNILILNATFRLRLMHRAMLLVGC